MTTIMQPMTKARIKPAEYDCLFYVWIRGGLRPKLINVNQARSCSRVGRRFYGIGFHGVISIGASTPIRFQQTNWRLRHHTCEGTLPSPAVRPGPLMSSASVLPVAITPNPFQTKFHRLLELET